MRCAQKKNATDPAVGPQTETSATKDRMELAGNFTTATPSFLFSLHTRTQKENTHAGQRKETLTIRRRGKKHARQTRKTAEK